MLRSYVTDNELKASRYRMYLALRVLVLQIVKGTNREDKSVYYAFDTWLMKKKKISLVYEESIEFDLVNNCDFLEVEIIIPKTSINT